MSVSAQNGVNRFDLEVAGRTVLDLMNDAVFTGVLNLGGTETCQVSSDNGLTWSNATNNYVVRDGDQLRFTRAAGTKG